MKVRFICWRGIWVETQTFRLSPKFVRVFASPHGSNFTVSPGSPRELGRAWTLARPSLRVLQVSSGEQVEACEKTARTATILMNINKNMAKLGWRDPRKIRRKIRRFYHRRKFQRLIFVEVKKWRIEPSTRVSSNSVYTASPTAAANH